MLKLKFQYFGHLMRKTDSFEKMLGKIQSRRRGRQLNRITNLMDMSLSKLRDDGQEAWRATVHGVGESDRTERLN